MYQLGLLLLENLPCRASADASLGCCSSYGQRCMPSIGNPSDCFSPLLLAFGFMPTTGQKTGLPQNFGSLLVPSSAPRQMMPLHHVKHKATCVMGCVHGCHLNPLWHWASDSSSISPLLGKCDIRCFGGCSLVHILTPRHKLATLMAQPARNWGKLGLCGSSWLQLRS